MRKVYVDEYRDQAATAMAKELARYLGNGFWMIGLQSARFETVWRGALAKTRVVCSAGWTFVEPSALQCFPMYRYDRPGD